MKKEGIIIANWKMNHNLSELNEYFKKFQLPVSSEHEICFAPQFPLLTSLKHVVAEKFSSKIKIVAQNCSSEKSGAYTGEVNADALKSIGVDYVIIGHSERRQYYFEDDQKIQNKMKQALSCNLNIVLCIGESLKQRENNELKAVLTQQLSSIDPILGEINFKHFVVAYEPVWAIGTGKVATVEQVREVHDFISTLLTEKFKSNSIPRIIYGGSVNTTNAQELFSVSSVAGFLVGGASLKPDDFSKICSVH